MAYLKPQAPLMNGTDYIYPITTADQIILSDGNRLEKNGKIVADSSNDSNKLGGIAASEYATHSDVSSYVSTAITNALNAIRNASGVSF